MAATRRLAFLAALLLLVIPVMAAAQGTVRIVQTNSAGDNVHIIDPETNTVIGEIMGIERAHGAAASPDGKWLYVANESDNTIDVVDMSQLKVVKQVPLSGRPNNIDVTPDGRKVYVAIAQSPGALEVLDTATNEIMATISVHGGVHNTYVTPDGKHAVAGMVGGRNITVVDTETDMPVWTTYFDLGIRPMTFDTHPDGSTRHIYAQLSNFNGFGVVNFETRKEITRIEYPEVATDERTPGHGGNTAHGIGVTPNNQYLVANSSLNSSVYVYTLPDLELVGGVRVGHSPNWVTITPDSKHAYISLSGNNSVAVLDIAEVKVVTTIETGGQVPKRNTTLVTGQ
ncbi:MAG: beta-propeller fold lactonase family protein [Acidobacteriota bacterium]|nr:beta-propeller fold lactonase family protein [Acidobacteriota bacterium]